MLTSVGYAELAWIVAALAFGGFTKGVTGLGLPLVTVPALASVFGVEQAVLIMVIPSVVLNFYPAWIHRDESAALPEIRRILVPAVPGIIVGASVLQFASDRFLAVSLAIWILAYFTLRLAHPHFSLSKSARHRWSPWVGLSAGALQAATGISAPVIASYMDAIALRPRAYVFAVSSCFGAFASGHMLVVIASGIYTESLLLQSLLAIFPALIFIQLGIWARRYIREGWFSWIVRILLVVMAGRLLWSTWSTA